MPVPRATYLARPAMAVTAEAATVGAIPQTFIVASDGTFRGELGDFQHLRGALVVAPDGAVSLVGDCSMTTPDGTTSTLTLTGTLTNGRMVGTSSAGDFDLAVTTLQDQPVDLPSKAGSYRTTSSSNGFTCVITIRPDGSIRGWAYATPEAADIGKTPVGAYTGSISYTDPTRNCFNIGFQFLPDGVGSPLPSTYGLAYFTPDGGIVALTANHLNPKAGQWSATFTKVP